MLEASQITQEALEIRDLSRKEKDCAENQIDELLNPVPPYYGGGEVKLIIIGQDPTIKNKKRRKNILCTLNLDKSGSLRNYAERICVGLGITMDNVYATNVFKYFYTDPPAYTGVLSKHKDENVVLLKKELDMYPDAHVITFGEPVLQLLTDDKAKVKYYWDYIKKTKKNAANYKKCGGAFKKCDMENKIGRIFYPFPHVPTVLRNEFYKENLEEYLDYMKYDINI